MTPVEKKTRTIIVTPTARAKAMRRVLRDDSKVKVTLTDPRNITPASGARAG